MMELPNHLVDWDTVKRLLRGAWAEGHADGVSDNAAKFLYGTTDRTDNPYEDNE